MEEKFTIICPDDAVLRQKIVDFVEYHDLPFAIEFSDRAPKGDASYNTMTYTVTAPFRLGQVIDAIFAAAAPKIEAQLDIGDCRLDTVTNQFSAPHLSSAVRLTEKETALLSLLYHEGGAPVARERLLREVWDYAEDVETHTLETHIYRLRQKIEADPSDPAILITCDDGYALRWDR